MDKKVNKGILLINKDEGFTSFDVVALTRGLLHEKRIGHTGTLDPMATGVLPILVGKATAAESLLPDTNKEYIATFKFGYNTDTQDSTGKTLQQFTSVVTQELLQEKIKNFVGNIMQVPPMYSALKVNGVKLYDLARQGIEVEREARPINVDYIILEDFDEQNQTGKLKISCSKGTYIRTLIYDIATTCGSGGVMTSLCRSKACGFSLDDCISISQARELSANNCLQDKLIPIDKIFSDYRETVASDKQAVRFCNGGCLSIKRLKIKDAKQDEIFRVYDGNNEFLGLGKADFTEDKNTIDEFGNLKIVKLFKG